MIERQERKKYQAMWKHDTYRKVSPAVKYVDIAINGLEIAQGDTLYDFGIGTGRAAQLIADKGISVVGVDIASNCLDEDCEITLIQSPLWELDTEPRDYGFCVDVMEHIPTEKVNETLRRISAHVTKSCFFVISTVPENHGMALIGEPLHLTVKPLMWWAEMLEPHFGNVTMFGLGDRIEAVATQE